HIDLCQKLLVLIGFITLIQSGISLLSPYLYKILIDEVMTAGKLELLKYVIPSMLGVFLISAALSGMNTYFNNKVTNKITLNLKRKMFNKIINKDIASWTSPDVGGLNNRIEADCNVVGGFAASQIVSFLSAFLFAALYLILMIIINPWLSVISVVFIPIAILFGRYTGGKFNKYNLELWQTGANNNSFLFDTIQKWREVKSNNIEDRLTDDYKNMLEPEMKINFKWMKYLALNDLFYAFKNDFVQKLLLFFVGGLFIISGSITIGGLLMFISYMQNLSANVDSIINSITAFAGNKAVYERLFEVLEEPAAEKQALKTKTPDIEIKNVSFAYNEKTDKVLSQINYSFGFGKKFLITGKSGEGKSTLIKLITCLNLPTEGKVFINEISTDEINQRSLFKLIGAVMQESMFFNLSIKENFRLLAPKATEEKMKNAADMACIDEFIEALPDKYNTIIGERGINFPEVRSSVLPSQG
ncbi:MAG: hypothetical protein K0S55_719, partial [Clostridia bacterium]|nr:hypothetical protein [Clostridia bacterium]